MRMPPVPGVSVIVMKPWLLPVQLSIKDQVAMLENDTAPEPTLPAVRDAVPRSDIVGTVRFLAKPISGDAAPDGVENGYANSVESSVSTSAYRLQALSSCS